MTLSQPAATATAAVASTPVWTLAGLVADDGRSRLDLARPAAGLEVAGNDRVLGLDLRSSSTATRLVDHWARGCDVVAVYEPADPRHLRATAMWRSLVAASGWELVVSAQTSLGESDSSLAVTCDLAGDQIAWGRGTETGVIWQPLGEAISPVEATGLLVRRSADAVLVAVHPADVRRILVARDAGRVRVTCWLFSAAIEKGVLLKSRVLAALGPAADTAWADALVVGLATAPPPLTA